MPDHPACRVPHTSNDLQTLSRRHRPNRIIQPLVSSALIRVGRAPAKGRDDHGERTTLRSIGVHRGLGRTRCASEISAGAPRNHRFGSANPRSLPSEDGHRVDPYAKRDLRAIHARSLRQFLERACTAPGRQSAAESQHRSATDTSPIDVKPILLSNPPDRLQRIHALAGRVSRLTALNVRQDTPKICKIRQIVVRLRTHHHHVRFPLLRHKHRSPCPIDPLVPLAQTSPIRTPIRDVTASSLHETIFDRRRQLYKSPYKTAAKYPFFKLTKINLSDYCTAVSAAPRRIQPPTASRFERFTTHHSRPTPATTIAALSH